MFETGFPANWSTLKKLIWLRGSGMNGSSPTYETVTGRIVSFLTQRIAPLKIEATLEPIQDLHGYENPWPAGGGKNKFPADFVSPYTQNGSTLTLQSDGKVTVSGTPSSAFDFVIGHTTLPAGEYILNGCPTGGGATKYRLQVTDYPVTSNLGQDSGSGVTFTLAEETAVAVRIQLYTSAPSSLTFAPMIRLSTESDATFAPYSNECPISGHTGAVVTRTGNNIWGGEKMADDMVAAVNNASKCNKGSDASGNYVMLDASSQISKILSTTLKFKENTQYTIILKAKNANNNATTNLHFLYTDGTKTYIDLPTASAGTVQTTVITSTSGKTVKGIEGHWGAGAAYLYYDDCGIFEGVLTADQFEPYSGTSVTLTFGQTVYGGKLTVNEDGTGTVVSDDAPLVFDNSTWGFSSNFFYKSFAGLQDVVSSNYYITENGIVVYCNGNNGQCRIYLNDNPSLTSETDVGALLNGYKLLYDLANPTTITLSPGQVNALLGNNTVWVDDSGNISVTYQSN